MPQKSNDGLADWIRMFNMRPFEAMIPILGRRSSGKQQLSSVLFCITMGTGSSITFEYASEPEKCKVFEGIIGNIDAYGVRKTGSMMSAADTVFEIIRVIFTYCSFNNKNLLYTRYSRKK